jgi:hypothetical protein
MLLELLKLHLAHLQLMHYSSREAAEGEKVAAEQAAFYQLIQVQ